MFDYYFSYFLNTFPKWSVGGYLAFTFICFVIICLLLIIADKKKWNKASVVATFFLMLYILYLYNTTFLSRESSEHFQNYLLRPFWSYKFPMKFIRDEIIREIIANVLAFVPIGFAFPIIKRRNCFLLALFTGFSFSMIIEISQLVTHKGFSEFDDLFHNTLGVVLGYLIFEFIKKTYIRIHKWREAKLHD